MTRKKINETHLYAPRREAILYAAKMFGLHDATRYLDQCRRDNRGWYDMLDLPCMRTDFGRHCRYSKSRSRAQKWLNSWEASARVITAYQRGRLGYREEAVTYTAIVPW